MKFIVIAVALLLYCGQSIAQEGYEFYKKARKYEYSAYRILHDSM